MRNSMAIDLDPEEKAFIEDGKIKKAEPKNKDASPKKLDSKIASKQDVKAIGKILLVPKNFRLPEKLSNKLKETSLKRRLRKDPLYTEQDIIAQALEDWFAKHEGKESNNG